MGTKMKKGILKPFRYFSNIMDGKEPEMQIGFPTDVKHVAHIGWDGPSVTNTNKDAAAPTWMKDYHSAPLDSSSFRSERGDSAAVSNPWASQEIVIDGDTSFRDTTSEVGSTAVDDPPSPGTRRSRRNRARGTSASSIDGSSEGTEKKKKGIRRRKKDKEKGAEDGGPCQDLPAVPKKSNRRKNKGNSEGSSHAAGKDAATEDGGSAPLPPVIEEQKEALL